MFTNLNLFNFLSVDGPPNINFFTPWGSADPTLRTYALCVALPSCSDRRWTFFQSLKSDC